MSRLTNDLFSLTELYHHGPEDVVISIIKFFGAFFILLSINVPLTLIIFSILPVMLCVRFVFQQEDGQGLQAEQGAGRRYQRPD